jgi:hypothetical protein
LTITARCWSCSIKAAPVKLLIIDELGYAPLSSTGAELLFKTFSQRYARGSTIVTSNLPLEDWTSVLGSERRTDALLGRLKHPVIILDKDSDCYRVKVCTGHRHTSANTAAADTTRPPLSTLIRAKSPRPAPTCKRRFTKSVSELRLDGI